MKYILPVTMFLLIILAPPLFSQEDSEIQFELTETEDTSAVITTVEIIGLKRTKPHVARYSLEKFIGRERSVYNQNEVFTAIKNTGVLEPVSSELIDFEDDLVLQVTVIEKWSIFPFPFVYAGSGGDLSYGLFFCDFNAFGLCDMMVFGGTYGSNGWSAFAMYNNTPDRPNIPGWNTVFMYTRRENEDLDRDENIIRKYEADILRLAMGINYEIADMLSASFSVSFLNITLAKEGDFINPPERKAMHIGFNPGISFQRSNWDGFFNSNQSISMDYTFSLALKGNSFHQAEFSGVYEQSLFPGFRMIIKSGASWKSTEDPLFEDNQQKATVNILPKNYSAMYYAGFSAGLEKYLLKFKWGTLSIFASWQGVFSGKENNNFDFFDHGPSGGLLVYLSRVALPAIGTSFSYNMVSGLYQFNFSVGMSF